ncbi:spore gernimation protein [Paenibacillus sp. FSL A5-0031]|uniref:GerAB/ArcD/ProY family transporter n=1 Tax=unclassified Paenibacillus TaxID=185978 RepID=UPI00096F7137|nr:endospore germination permease [Paenibacillus sp. FSL A5-0031]OME78342.1 spore gernimation protein [Paenibacillus sp. FSL A5-0031]
MSGSGNKISFVQIFMMFSLMNGLASHVIVNPMILSASKRDSWITVLMTGVFFLIWILLLVWIMNRSGQQEWKKWLSRRSSPFVSWLLILPVCIQMYLIGGMTVIHTATWHVTNYLPSTPKMLLVVSLVLFCTAMSMWGLKVIAIVAGVLLPLVALLGIFVGSFNSPMKDFSLLKPVLEHGWSPVWNGMVYSGAGFVELMALIVLQHHLKTKVRAWQLLLYGVFSIVISLGPIVGAITEFGPIEASHQMTSPYEQWRLVKIGQFVEHLDFLSIFQWLSGAIVRISLSVYLFVELLSLRQARSRHWAIAIIMVSYILLSLFRVNEYTFYLWMDRYYMPISLAVLLSFSFLWMIAALFLGSASKEGKT